MPRMTGLIYISVMVVMSCAFQYQAKLLADSIAPVLARNAGSVRSAGSDTDRLYAESVEIVFGGHSMKDYKDIDGARIRQHVEEQCQLRIETPQSL